MQSSHCTALIALNACLRDRHSRSLIAAKQVARIFAAGVGAVSAQEITAAPSSQSQAGLGGEMKQPLAHRVAIPSARVPSAAREAVASI